MDAWMNFRYNTKGELKIYVWGGAGIRGHVMTRDHKFS